MENQNYNQNESQNQEPQAKKKWFASLSRGKKIAIVVIAVLVLFNVVGRGIAFHAGPGMRGHHGQAAIAAMHGGMRGGNVALAAKDFEPLGIVFAENAASGRGGHAEAHNALMREAAALGADAIINVSISSTGWAFNRTWSGSALAVRYLETIPGEIGNAPAFMQMPGRRGSWGRGWF